MLTPYYEGDGITLYHGDCLFVMPLLSSTFDFVLADLPYGSTRNDWDREIPAKLLWSQYHALIGKRTAVALFGSGIFSARTVVSNERQYKYSLVWDKAAVTGHLNAKKRPLAAHEEVHVFYEAQPTYNPQMVFTGRSSHSRGKRTDRTINHWGHFTNTEVVEQAGYQYPRSILTFPRPKLPKGFTGHPNQKPVALCEWFVRTFTNEGELVLDNVAGSGTTLVAARNAGRRAIGIEAREDYCEMAATRLASGSPEDRW